MREVQEKYFLGLDLGQSADFSALVALRRVRTVEDDLYVRRYAVRGLKLWPLETLYTSIVDDVTTLVARPPLAGCVLGVDRTGCGQPVVDMLNRARPAVKVQPVLITAGFAVGGDEHSVHVPKRDLVAVVQTLLQARRLEIPATIPEAATLERELLSFRARISAKGHESFEADWRLKAHDDIVLGLAIAAWLGENWVDPYTGPLVLNLPPEPASQKAWTLETPEQIVKRSLEQADREDGDDDLWRRRP